MYRLHARLLAAAQETQLTPERRASLLVGARVRCRPDDAAFYCLQRQAVRFEGLR